jgi:hypothetical protein
VWRLQDSSRSLRRLVEELSLLERKVFWLFSKVSG